MTHETQVGAPIGQSFFSSQRPTAPCYFRYIGIGIRRWLLSSWKICVRNFSRGLMYARRNTPRPPMTCVQSNRKISATPLHGKKEKKLAWLWPSHQPARTQDSSCLFRIRALLVSCLNARLSLVCDDSTTAAGNGRAEGGAKLPRIVCERDVARARLHRYGARAPAPLAATSIAWP